MKHFYARAFSLIIVPIGIYLFWFYIHFAILNESGPGDSFMSSRFQDTLKNSPLKMSALGNVLCKQKKSFFYLLNSCRNSLR